MKRSVYSAFIRDLESQAAKIRHDLHLLMLFKVSDCNEWFVYKYTHALLTQWRRKLHNKPKPLTCLKGAKMSGRQITSVDTLITFNKVKTWPFSSLGSKTKKLTKLMYGHGGYWQINRNHMLDFDQSRTRNFYSERRLHIKVYENIKTEVLW